MGTRSLRYDPERMRTRFRPYDPDQQQLLPQDLREWVPAGHLAHHVSDLVDALDLSPFYARYEGDGRRRSPYDPRMMVKVLVYGYATGVFSSRRLARKLEEDVPLRMLAAGNFPAHRTLCEFRKKNLKAFGALFAEVVRLARELGLAGLGRVAVDGTKVRANASKRKAMSYGRMGPEEARLEAEIADLLAAAEAIDAEEDERHGEDVRGDELGLPRFSGQVKVVVSSFLATSRERRAVAAPKAWRTVGEGRGPGVTPPPLSRAPRSWRATRSRGSSAAGADCTSPR